MALRMTSAAARIYQHHHRHFVGQLTIILLAGTTISLILPLGIASVWAANLIGTPGADDLEGTPDDDNISGLAGDDTLNGNDGQDYISGGSRADQMDGGEGIDQINGDKGAHFVELGPGVDG